MPSAFRIDVIVSNSHLDLRHLVLNHPWITCHGSAILLFWEVDRFVNGWDQLSHFQPFWSIPSSPFATVTAKDGRIPPGAGHTVPTRSSTAPEFDRYTHLQLRKFWYCRLYWDQKSYTTNMTGWKFPMFNRKYIFKCLFFIAMLVFLGGRHYEFGGRLIHIKTVAKSGKFARQNFDDSKLGFFGRAFVSSGSCGIEQNAMVTSQACL